MTTALAPVLLAEVLHVARLRNASDVHLRAASPPVLRIDGMLETLESVGPSAEEIREIVAAMLPEKAQRHLALHGDVTATYRDAEAGCIRVHAYNAASSMAVAMRLLAATVPTFEDLHLPAAVGAFAERSSGLVLFAGPTGSGKSTALAAIVDRINRSQAKHIITIEDPIEYRHRSNRSVVTQREVGTDVPSFSDAIYGALRSDPDVILIGEMRDSATMHAALTAAETGHLVLATLHTGDAPQTVDRIIGVFAGEMQEQVRMQLAQTLIGIVCTRLLPRACGEGRRCAAEVLVATDAVRNLIREGKTHQIRNVMSTCAQAGMQTLEAHLSDLVARREVTLHAAKAVTERPGDLRIAEKVMS